MFGADYGNVEFNKGVTKLSVINKDHGVIVVNILGPKHVVDFNNVIKIDAKLTNPRVGIPFSGVSQWLFFLK